MVETYSGWGNTPTAMAGVHKNETQNKDVTICTQGMLSSRSIPLQKAPVGYQDAGGVSRPQGIA